MTLTIATWVPLHKSSLPRAADFAVGDYQRRVFTVAEGRWFSTALRPVSAIFFVNGHWNFTTLSLYKPYAICVGAASLMSPLSIFSHSYAILWRQTGSTWRHKLSKQDKTYEIFGVNCSVIFNTMRLGSRIIDTYILSLMVWFVMQQ